MKELHEHLPFAKKACEFLSASPDPYHAVLNSVTKLKAAGYQQLSKRQPFTGQILPGGKYYYTVNKTSLVAFAVGQNYKEGNGIKVIGGHTDSPNLKVKPRSKRDGGGSGCIMLNVECYGGGLWHTWFDRDLGVSGRVLVRSKEEEEDGSGSGKEKVEQQFIKVDDPIARVSTLCIHLESAEERRAFKVNKENHLCPIIGTQSVQQQLEKSVQAQLDGNGNGNESSNGDDDGNDKESEEELDFWQKEQEPQLLKLIASKLNIQTSQIADFELNLFDTQPASLGGINSEFLYSARLDNLATCYVAIEALISHSTNEALMQVEEDVSIVCLFDHEEVGNTSAQGAASPIMEEAVKRIITALSSNTGYLNPDVYASAIRKSFVMSVDQAHAIHPNYASKHEKNHAPLMNAGVVIKSNANQRYATNSITGFIIRELTRKANIAPVQEFSVRNDCPCGSTIGPTISANTGIRTVDCGMPQLSMHSCREVMGIVDLTNGYELFQAFFKHFREIDDCLEG